MKDQEVKKVIRSLEYFTLRNRIFFQNSSDDKSNKCGKKAFLSNYGENLLISDWKFLRNFESCFSLRGGRVKWFQGTVIHS